MKYAKYILIVLALYFGIEYHNKYLNTKKEIESIEDSYKNELERKIKEYYLNSEKIEFQSDSAEIILDQKYLYLKHDNEVQHLSNKINDQSYYAKLKELEKNESEENLLIIESSFTKSEKIDWPETPIPELMYKKRNSSQDNSKTLFVISGLLLLIFPLVDISKWRKGRRQPQKSIQENRPPTSLMEQMIYNGQTLTRLPGNDGKGEKTEVFEDQNGQYVEVPNTDVEAWEMANNQTNDNMMKYDVDGKMVLLERQRIELEDGEVVDEWIDENGMPVEVPEETTKAWDTAKAKAKDPNANPNVVTCT